MHAWCIDTSIDSNPDKREETSSVGIDQNLGSNASSSPVEVFTSSPSQSKKDLSALEILELVCVMENISFTAIDI